MGEGEDIIAGLLPANVGSGGESVPVVDVVGGAEARTKEHTKVRNFFRGLVSGCMNGGLMMAEVSRYNIREGKTLVDGTNDFLYDLLHKNTFAFNHVGDVFEAGEVIFGVRSLLELGDFLWQKAGNEKWDPRVKLWISAIMGFAVPTVLEGIGYTAGGWNTPEILDGFGPLISCLLVGGSWELTSFLVDADKQMKMAEGVDKINQGFRLSVNRVEKAMNDLQRHLKERIDFGDKWIDQVAKVGLNNVINKIDLSYAIGFKRIESATEKLHVIPDRVINAIFRLFERREKDSS